MDAVDRALEDRHPRGAGRGSRDETNADRDKVGGRRAVNSSRSSA